MIESEIPWMPRTMIFGYGSLTGIQRLERFTGRALPAGSWGLAGLRGYRRVWNTAMDNALDLPGYKFYLTKEGHRPPYFITFLNIEKDPACAVNGVLFEAGNDEVARFDRRERNYQRIEVTDRVTPRQTGARVWTYIATAAARARYQEGVKRGLARVNARYFALVREAFATHGAEALQAFDGSTDLPEVPMVELICHAVADQ
jgi:hypothetical protein